MQTRSHVLPESIIDFHQNLADRKCTVEEVVKLYLGIIELRNPDTNAYLEVYAEEALAHAKKCDEFIAGKTKQEIESHVWKHKLFGVPYALKDNMCMKGKIVSASSKILEHYSASYTATALQKISEAGAICLGRLNMDEFAMGGSTENSAYGVTKNPLALEYVAGGSSGGSAAAVAMDSCVFSLGSDTGGSIRQPSSYCGVIGLKPTYGSVSRHGLIAMASSFDVIGPIAKNVEDTELVFEVIKGVDVLDSTSHATKPIEAHETLPRHGMKVGVPKEFIFTDGVSKEVQDSVKATIAKLESKGVKIVDISLPLLKHALALYYVLVPAEVSSNMARFDGVRYGEQAEGKDLLETYMNTRGQLLGSEVKRRIMLGTYVLSAGYHDAYYKKALALREELTRDLQKVLGDVDAVLTPTTPDTAFKIGEKNTDPLSLYLADIFTVTANLTAMPAISIPFIESIDEHGTPAYGTANGLPLGIQFMADIDKEANLFALGKMIY
ncbi:MAG: Asp-tRNA(Asn)/Glu-tRNA(Gln) amidotransferase subunit GatA [Patescibacteria group bacterium]